MRHEIVTPPASEPLTLEDAKAYLRVTHDSEDVLIASQIAAARRLCENAARMSFITQTRKSTYRLPKVTYDNDYGSLLTNVQDPDGINSRIELVRGPIASIASVKVYHTPATMMDITATGNAATDVYFYNPSSQTLEWVPELFSPLLETNDFIEVTYVAGLGVSAFGDSYSDVLDAIKITLAALYDQRGYSRQSCPPAAANILAAYWRPAP